MTKTMKVEGPLHVVCQCDKCKASPEQKPVAWMSPHIKDLARPGQEIEQQAEPTPWRDMVVVSLVREGINKHRARELADHFAAQPRQQAEFDCPRCGHVCSQRQWQGLTTEEVKHLYPYGRSVWGKETFEAIEAMLKKKNT